MSARPEQTLLERLLASPEREFVLLHRPEGPHGPGVLEVLTGTAGTAATLDAIPLRPDAGPGHDVFAVLPYRQVAERGYPAPDDGRPLIVLTVEEEERIPLGLATELLPARPPRVGEGDFDLTDEEYARLVSRLVADEIGTGQGANFVLRRSYHTQIEDYRTADALSFFRRLLLRERGAYWTFLIHVAGVTLVGASPERHVSLTGGQAVMNPISGTYRYPASGPTLDGVTRFLADRKEAEELYMVVDEELKMMSRICYGPVRVTGPRLKEMAHLAHTEYFIEGRTARDVREVLRETMFAPTVTGSPLESAFRVIERYEPQGRGYYSGVAALIGRERDGAPTADGAPEHADGARLPDGGRDMDTAILIRTAEISPTGRVEIGAGSTIVRHSDPASEAKETRGKINGLLHALEGAEARPLGRHPEVLAALERRNGPLADYWLGGDVPPFEPPAALKGRRVLVIDAEDTFTAMIEHQLRSLALDVTVRRFDERADPAGYDLVVMGPGPGDPNETGDAKISALRHAVGRLLDERRPFLAVCLSHQVLSTLLGLEVRRKEHPNQGLQREIDLFGTPRRVGFYNTFAAQSGSALLEHPRYGAVEVSRDPESGEVHGLRAAAFASVQFHPESVLSLEGPQIMADLLLGLVD